jgi:hypothetical protein
MGVVVLFFVLEIVFMFDLILESRILKSGPALSLFLHFVSVVAAQF